MKPALSQVCTLNSTLTKDIEGYSANHCEFIELWLTKVERELQQRSLDDIKQLLSSNRIVAAVASFQGGILTSQGEARRVAWELFQRRLELCRQLQVSTLVVVGDLIGQLSPQDLQRAQVSLVEAARLAEQSSVRIAFEFQAGATFANNLQTAVALLNEIHHPALGLCLDMFHFYVGPSKTEDLQLLTKENLFHVQLCDLADVPRELATDSDRILPGDGDIALQPVVQRLRDIGYEGCISVELMNPSIWQVPALQFADVAMTALRKLLGQAEGYQLQPK